MQIEFGARKKREGKNLRREREDVLQDLFKAFEKHQYYAFKDLLLLTKQPVVRDVYLPFTRHPHLFWFTDPIHKCFASTVDIPHGNTERNCGFQFQTTAPEHVGAKTGVPSLRLKRRLNDMKTLHEPQLIYACTYLLVAKRPLIRQDYRSRPLAFRVALCFGNTQVVVGERIYEIH